MVHSTIRWKEEMYMARKSSTAMADTLFLIGGGVLGAGVALLFAPQTGKKCRRQLTQFGRSVSKQGDRAWRNISDSMTDFSGKMSGMTSGMFSKKTGGWFRS